jgi:hypothetical protein
MYFGFRIECRVDAISPELAYGETGGLSGSVKGASSIKGPGPRVEGGFLSRWLADTIYTAIGTAFIHLSAGA